MEKNWKENFAKVKLLMNCQKQSLKIAVAHHDRNNVPTIIFVNVKRNYYQINGEWKYFHENLKKNYIAIVDIDIVDIDIGKNFLDFVEENKGRKDILATSIDK